ncbi:hypothetical protein BH09ACT10_BH09ACT10_21810 [soil metagenome]
MSPVADRHDIELLNTLDEKFIVNDIAFEAMHSSALLVLEASATRSPDGTVDRQIFRDFATTLAVTVPALQHRIVRAPLGITTPAMVPSVTFDLKDHLIFHPDVLSLGAADMEFLCTRGMAPLDFDKPLWGCVVIELDDGRVAVAMRSHHVFGDAMFALNALDSVLGEEPTDLAPPKLESNLAAPRVGWGRILRISGLRWYRRQGSVKSAWHEYWRKPFMKRLRRSGGRILRPAKNAVIRRRGLAAKYLPPRWSRYEVIEFAEVTRRADALGCTLTELIVAVTLKALARDRSEEISVLVPISRRTDGDEDIRNHISTVRVSVDPRLSVAEMAAIVHQQVQVVVKSGRSKIDGPGEMLGYVTYVPWASHQRFVGPAAVEEFVAWPVGDPRDPMACLMVRHGEQLTISLTTHRTTDIDRLMHDLLASIHVDEPADKGTLG